MPKTVGSRVEGFLGGTYSSTQFLWFWVIATHLVPDRMTEQGNYHSLFWGDLSQGGESGCQPRGLGWKWLGSWPEGSGSQPDLVWVLPLAGGFLMAHSS